MSIAIATVILLSITVALALAVSGWITAFSVNSMETEALWISDISYQGQSGESDNQIALTIENSGSYSVTILEATVTGSNVEQLIDDLELTIKAGKNQVLLLNNTGWIAGYRYQFKFISGRGNTFVTIDTA